MDPIRRGQEITKSEYGVKSQKSPYEKALDLYRERGDEEDSLESDILTFSKYHNVIATNDCLCLYKRANSCFPDLSMDSEFIFQDPEACDSFYVYLCVGSMQVALTSVCYVLPYISYHRFYGGKKLFNIIKMDRLWSLLNR